MAVNKVVFGNTTVMDITDSTVTASKLKSGETAYAANGAKIIGELIVPEVLDDLSDVTIVSPENAHEIYYDGSQWINYGAKILLTFDDAFQGQTITLVNGQTTITKTAPLTGNSMSLYVSETGEWTISSTIDEETYETVVTITAFGITYTAELESTPPTPEGSTVTPTDDIQTWLRCANLNKPYTTLAEVLADRETFETLIADSNACDYMARSTTWASDVADDADAMSLIGKYDYCSNALLGNATWASAIANSDYWDLVLQPLVPAMTSNTTPSGVASASTIMSSTYDAWRAFSGNGGMAWVANGSAPHWLAYVFPTQTQIIGFTFMTDMVADRQFSNYKVQGYNGESWEDIPGVSYSSTTTKNTKYKYFFSQFYNYIGYRIYIGTQGTMTPLLKLVNFIGRKSVQATNTNGIIHTANGDTVTCNGNTYVADTNGIIDIDFSDFDEGTYTFTSGIAKDPTDLSNYYSKSFKITKSPYGGTTEMYLMPDTVKTLYWWGYESDNLEDCTSANGWSGTYAYVAPTHNTHNISLNPTASQLCGIGTKNPVSTSKFYGIATATSGNNAYVIASNSNPVSKATGSTSDLSSIFTSSISRQSVSNSKSPTYASIRFAVSTVGTCNAFWYE